MKAIRPLSSASFAPLISIEDGNVGSVDPNVVMAHAYHKSQSKKGDDKSSTKNGDGPLAFLGLQRRGSRDEDEKVCQFCIFTVTLTFRFCDSNQP